MRGTVAKRIRRQIYGDFSTATSERTYSKKTPDHEVKMTFMRKIEGVLTKVVEKITLTGEVVNTGLRRDYQLAKRRYKNGEGN